MGNDNNITGHQTIDQTPAHRALENLRMRLLDLTARNRLINFRHTKNTSLRIIDELPNQLVETLLAESEMRFMAISEPTEEDLIAAGYLEFDKETQQLIRLRNDPSAEEWAKYLGFSTSYEMPEAPNDNDSAKHSDKSIQTLLYPYEMEARLKNLLQSAESAIQEMGTNILYLAIGFLEWYDTNNPDKARAAPLFLMPVHLHKGWLNTKTHTYEYTLSYSGEEIIPNLSLREKLRIDFAMALPDLDENSVPEEYFHKVLALIEEHQPRWRMRRSISLALLNFSKLLMYLDLDPARWPKKANIVNHPVVSRFLSGYGQETEDADESMENPGFAEEYLIDEMDEMHTHYPLIDDADSSQHSALIDAVNGKNLVIEGPPGTGKSQTITNLIAAAMAQGKRVLFVAEKLAALEVVRSRLDNAGLGEFCLELHSHKSQKRKVLDEVKARLKKNGRYRKPINIEVDIARYEVLKMTLKSHAEKINQPWKRTGKTRHEIFMAATRYRNATGIDPKELYPVGYDGEHFDVATQRRNEEQIDVYCKIYQAVVSQLEGEAKLHSHPWFGVRNGNLQMFDLERVKESLNAWQTSLMRLSSQRDEIAHTLGCDTSAVAETLTKAELFLDELNSIPQLVGDEILDRLPILRGDVLEQAQHHLKLFEDIQVRYRSLANRAGPEIVQDLSIVEPMLSGSEQLKTLVESQVVLGDLAGAIKRLTSIEERLTQLSEPLQGLLSELGEPAARYLTLSESGLTEFKRVIELIAMLNPSYWKHRDERYDSEELDELLPRLRADQEALQQQHDSIKGLFALHNLPDEHEIRQLTSRLASGGLFCWFNSDWRAARKQLLSYAATPQVSYSSLAERLDDLATFLDKRNEFESNTRYKEAVGDHLQGLATDLTMLESLRAWYKEVRKQYGVGFGQKVALGDALLALSPNMGKAIRSLAEQAVPTQLNGLFNDLGSLKQLFAPAAKLHDTKSILIGEEGVIPRILSELNQAIHACGTLIRDSSLSLAELLDRIEQLERLKQSVDHWQESDFDKKLFQGRLGIKPGMDEDNDAGLSMLRHTLALAASLASQLNNQALIDALYEHPAESVFSLLHSYSQQLQAIMASIEASHDAFATLVQLDQEGWTIHCGERIDALIQRNKLALDNGAFLQNWLDYVRVRDQIEAIGLGRLADGVECRELQIEQLEEAYLSGIFDLLAREILREDSELSHFSGHSQEALQSKFKEYDNHLKLLQCEQIAWKIDQTKIPIGNKAARVSERSERVLLEHECGKKTRHIPIRQLLKRASSALVALKPCFMMGPMSVAQYLAPGEIDFDLVVMDEASQIKPQDALGAIARGRQLVVVGDPKQLPPTSFFNRIIEEDEDNLTGLEESESILDATLPMFPARRLRWHYRSQHESLIAFSNQSFYESDLVIFPSPHKQTENYGIHYSRIARGCFVNRRNMEEAKIISEAVREHFKHHPEESLGVVAMSAEQRLQIERAVETLVKDDVAFQDLLDEDAMRHESLFIKNLENVQGDERDVIFISMTYGPMEPGGKVFQRFGPINSDEGWRRLNVLFTRSKKRMHIFSSMNSDEIVVGPTSKRGVRALRDFLDFCETGMPHKTRQMIERSPASDFEIAVISALHKEGFESIPQVGVAGFFIDVAVVDPGNPGRYLMGIECDGTTYHSAKSVRDRDRLRQTILERLGWRIRRIWSTDWYKNPQGELIAIIRELHELKSAITPIEVEPESEVSEIEEIIQEVDIEETQVVPFAFEKKSLKEKLIQFDREVIQKAFPETAENKRLLRPAMLEALLQYTPTSRVEFLEAIPSYMREAVEETENNYLDQVFGIINASLDEI
ncbi:MAG: DUF4011 domain-containing protein [Candidatus Thiodiazotropha sp.]